MNRRTLIKSAAGLLVAAPALLTPERTVWALDRTMLAPYSLPLVVGIDPGSDHTAIYLSQPPIIKPGWSYVSGSTVTNRYTFTHDDGYYETWEGETLIRIGYNLHAATS